MIRPLDPGARLRAAASLVRWGRPAADIGCDHGKLAVYLVESGRCPSVVAADLRPGPLRGAQTLAAQRGLSDRIDCRLGGGLSVLAPGEVRDLVIAGMGGLTIAGILGDAPWVRDAGYHLVLLPASGAADLRRWLAEHGFEIRAELPVAEAGHSYAAMQAAYTGRRVQPTALFCLLGRLRGQRSADAAACFAAAAHRLEQELQGRRRAGETDLSALEALLKEVKKEMSECQE